MKKIKLPKIKFDKLKKKRYFLIDNLKVYLKEGQKLTVKLYNRIKKLLKERKKLRSDTIQEEIKKARELVQVDKKEQQEILKPTQILSNILQQSKEEQLKEIRDIQSKLEIEKQMRETAEQKTETVKGSLIKQKLINQGFNLQGTRKNTNFIELNNIIKKILSLGFSFNQLKNKLNIDGSNYIEILNNLLKRNNYSIDKIKKYIRDKLKISNKIITEKLTATEEQLVNDIIENKLKEEQEEEPKQEEEITLLKPKDIEPQAEEPKEEQEEEKEQDTFTQQQDEIERLFKEIEETRKEQQGKGHNMRGLYNTEIDKLMEKYPEYRGCISSDEVEKLILPQIKDDDPSSKIGCFIINTKGSNHPGEHWQAVYYDGINKNQICYYDPYGFDNGNDGYPDKNLMDDIYKIDKKLNSKQYNKFKFNMVKNQNNISDNCGWISCNFLMNMIRNGGNFKEATGFIDIDNSRIKEKEAEKLKQKEFKYIIDKNIKGGGQLINPDYILQSIIFNKSKYSMKDALKLLQKYNMKPIKPVDISDNYYRYRFSEPDHQKMKYKTISQNGIQFIFKYK